MITMSFLNPLSSEGKQIVRDESIDLEIIFDEKEGLIDKIYSIKSQDISDDIFIPQNYADLVIKRVEWYVEKKVDSRYNHKKYAFLFHPQITKYDLVAFFILCQSVGVNYGPNSRESRALVELQGQIVENRLQELNSNKKLKEDLMRQVLSELLIQDKIKWEQFSDLLGSKKLDLNDLVLKDGYVILDKDEFIQIFQDKIKQRKPQKMYELLIGDRIKELILIKMVMQETEDYIKSVHKRSVTYEPNPALIKIGEKISQALSKETKYYRGSFGGGKISASPLNVELFPPCIKLALEGIKSGGRNEVIVLFLTPFLSYARLNPQVFGGRSSLKLSDADPNLNITNTEILPMIYDAADRCIPPLFDDQPQERVNINAKLGFGMHTQLNLGNEGETKWYTPMSCDKVKMNMPALCKPDDTCKKLKEINPLFYYTHQMLK